MKKKLKVTIFLTIALLAIALVIGFVQQRKAKERAEEIAQGYFAIWDAIPNTKSTRYEYADYSVVREDELYLQMMAYNHCMKKDLTLDDFKEFLSKEKNEDGTLRIEEGYENIHDYVDWYYYPGKKGELGPYENELVNIYVEFKENIDEELPEFTLLSREQLTEIMKKLDDPSYEIDAGKWGISTD